MRYYVEWYAPWRFNSLTPARRLVLQVSVLIVVPIVTLMATVWVVNIPWGRMNDCRTHVVEEWKLNEKVVRDSYHFNHEEYIKWLAEQ